jgi:NADPH2:quinone reductase
MKALVCREWGPVEHLTIDDMAEARPGPGEVVIDVKAAGVNFPDTLIIQGKYQFRPELPFVPGGEAAGVVTQVGDGVMEIEEGARVIAIGSSGAFAQRWCVPASMVVAIPDGMDFVTAAGFGMIYGTAHYALVERAKLASGETVLVLGAAGGVGTATVQVSKALGARVIAAASSDEKVAFALDMGADEGINYATEDLRGRLKQLTGGVGVDVVLDPVGGDMTEMALRSTAWNGRLLVIGFASGTIPSVATNLALLKGASIVGVFWGSWALRDPAASQAAFRELFSMVEDGRLHPPTAEVRPLEDFAEAFHAFTSRTVKGKLVLIP